MTWRADRHFPCSSTSPALARQYCADQLRIALDDWLADGELVDDATLITSELVTNAVQAGCGELDYVLEIDDGLVRLHVIDDVAGMPVLAQPAGDTGHGRGLLITAALANHWGVEPRPPGKDVWAELVV